MAEKFTSGDSKSTYFILTSIPPFNLSYDTTSCDATNPKEITGAAPPNIKPSDFFGSRVSEASSLIKKALKK